MTAGKCVFCGREVNPDVDYREVTGFERYRKAGGTNAIRLRKPGERWACTPCVDRMAKGIAYSQQSLL